MPSGTKLGKYEVVSRLGSGGMAEIFLARTRDRLCVLKKVLPDVKADPEAVQMFLDEARITALLSHPNIARVYELGEADGDLFLAMEFIPGADLVEVAKACAEANEPIPTGFSLRAAHDCALALHAAHTFRDARGPNPVIHRDVAEKNVMVTFEGVTKLLDFGIAKAKGRATRTATGMVKGTSGYMAPEQVRGDPIDARVDVFSLGVVLHELLTGQRLFYGHDAASELVAVLNMDAFPPSQRNAEVTPQLDAVVLKALAKDREGRFATALEFAEAIARAGRGLMWSERQCGALVARLFADRRAEQRRWVEGASAPGRKGLAERGEGVAQERRAAAEGGAAVVPGRRAPRAPEQGAAVVPEREVAGAAERHPAVALDRQGAGAAERHATRAAGGSAALARERHTTGAAERGLPAAPERRTARAAEGSPARAVDRDSAAAPAHTAHPDRRHDVAQEQTVLHAPQRAPALTLDVPNPFEDPDATVLKRPSRPERAEPPPASRRVSRGVWLAAMFALIAVLSAIALGLYLSTEPSGPREAPPRVEF